MPRSEGPDTPETWRGRATSACVVLAAFAGGLALLTQVLEHGPVGTWRQVDVVAGLAASLGLLARRRAPVVVAGVLAVAAAVVATAGVANMVALYFVARHRPLPVALAIGAADVAAGWAFWLVYPGNQSLSLTLTVNLAIAAAVVAWGALLRSQGALLEAYRDRAEQAERDEALRAEAIRAAERTRIAREMHDVVAHKISLVALHAGGLEVAPEHDPDVVRRSAELIRASSNEALDELRAVIGLLRADEPRTLEQPGLARLPDLLREARAAGQLVDLELEPAVEAAATTAPEPGASRDAYRVVQEGLTNARKHAPGQPVRVTLTSRADGLEVIVRNACAGRSLGVTGSGSGLIGLKERVGLAGGTLRHGVGPTGEFELTARLPWR